MQKQSNYILSFVVKNNLYIVNYHDKL